VYKNDGKKVYYPFDPPPFIDGVRINSPHYLAQVRKTYVTLAAWSLPRFREIGLISLQEIQTSLR
jgi:calpain-7